MNLWQGERNVPNEVKWRPEGCHCPQEQGGSRRAPVEQEERTAFDGSAPEGVGRELHYRNGLRTRKERGQNPARRRRDKYGGKGRKVGWLVAISVKTEVWQSRGVVLL